jgi:PKD domain
MKKGIQYSLIISYILLISISACKKKTVPTGDAGVIEFLFDGQINGQVKKIEAGRFNNYMHTNYYNSADNILNFEGQIGQINNTNNSEYLKVIFKNYTGSSNPNADSLFTIGDYYSFSVDTNTTIAIQGKAVQFTFTGITQNVNNYLWTFGDGQTSTDANPYHVYTISGKVNVSCLVSYSTGQQDFLQNNIDVTYGSNCNAQFSITKLSGDSLQCTATGVSGNYTWQLPNGTTQTGISIEYNTPIVFRDYISIIDNGACGTNYRQVVAPSNTVAIVNYNYSIKDTSYTQSITPNTNFKKVIVEYSDGTKKYSSYKNDITLHQSNKKILNIISKNLYQKNSAGMRTVKVNAELGTYLYNMANNADSIFVYSNRLQLAVAFP